MNIEGQRILVTGGASFIGSHLVEALVKRNVRSIRIVDDLSSGLYEPHDLSLGKYRPNYIEFVMDDLKDPLIATFAVSDIDVVFHLAADHGGRGYVDTHQTDCAFNMMLDQLVFSACAKSDSVEHVMYASSGCVYPNHLQTNPDEDLYLSENMVGPPYDADNMYGWAKLMGEMTLQSLCDDGILKGVSCRYFTVYGPRGKEDHAVIAMMARAFIQQDPYVIWGDGNQIRNWTYIDDIVDGTIAAVEKIENGQAINLGTQERIRVIDAARAICEYADFEPHEWDFQLDMPTGPVNRVANNGLALELLRWRNIILFAGGIKDTYDWYKENHVEDEVAEKLEEMLLSR